MYSAPYGRAGSLRSLLEVCFAFSPFLKFAHGRSPFFDRRCVVLSAARRPYFGCPHSVFLLKIVLRTIFPFSTASDGVSFVRPFAALTLLPIMHLQLVYSAPYGRAGSLRSRFESAPRSISVFRSSLPVPPRPRRPFFGCPHSVFSVLRFFAEAFIVFVSSDLCFIYSINSFT